MKDNRSLPEIEQEILKSATKAIAAGSDEKTDDGDSPKLVEGSSSSSSGKELVDVDAKEKDDAKSVTAVAATEPGAVTTTSSASISSRNPKLDDDTGSAAMTSDRPSTSSSSAAPEGRILEGWMSSFRSSSRHDLTDSERILRSVEPLPSTTTTTTTGTEIMGTGRRREDSVTSTPGAHNVSTQGVVVATTRSSCTGSIVSSTTEQRLPEVTHGGGGSTRTFGTDDVSSYFDIETGSHHLVEAHLVNDDDDGGGGDVQRDPSAQGDKDDSNNDGEELVHAEKLTLVDLSQQRRLQVALGFAALAIVVLVVTVIALVVKGDNGEGTNSSNPDATLIDPVIPPPKPLQEEEDQPFAVPADSNATNSKQDEVKCFGSSEELYKAITAYFHNPSPNSTMALQYGYPIGSWCVSKIWNFGFMMKAPPRNHYVVADDGNNTTNNVTTTQEAQEFAYHFSNDIGNWDMRKARQLEEMFHGNQNISTDLGIDRWELSRATSLRGMFMETHWQQAQVGALDLSSWNTSSVMNLAQLFRNSNVETAGVANWDTSKVTILWQFANEATFFNDDLSHWNVERVTSITGAFQGTKNFQQNINTWQTSSLVRMNMAFLNSTFNQPLSGWDVSKVETLRGTFKDSAFNQDINDWDVSNVNVLRQAFDSSSFNQDIAQWDVSKVVDARWTFTGATNFSQNLCAWGSKLPTNVLVDGMFKHSACPNTSDPVIPGGPFCFNC